MWHPFWMKRELPSGQDVYKRQVLYGREALLEQMPPFLNGGEMIEYVTRTGAAYAELPHKFEAGTVNGGGAVALAAALDYMDSIGMDNIVCKEQELTKYAFEGMQQIPGVQIIGSPNWEEHHGIISFAVQDVHPHDVASILDEEGVAIRAGHHCCLLYTSVSNVLGCINPVEAIIEKVHANGGVVLVDAAQSAPHIKVDVMKLDADFVAFSGHKLMAPMGIGVLYGREALLEQMPPFLNGGEMIEYVTRTGAAYAELPHKFEAGTVNGGGAVALAAALDYMDSIGMDNIVCKEQELTKYAFEGMQQIPGVQIIGSPNWEEHHGIISFAVQDVHPPDVASILDEEGVAIRARCV